MVRSLFGMIRQIIANWSLHQNSRNAAAIAYFSLFTLAPILVFATMIAGMVISEQAAEYEIRNLLSSWIGASGQQIADAIFTNAHFFKHGPVLIIATTLVLIYGASSSVAQLRLALNGIFDESERLDVDSRMHSFLIGRVLSAVSMIVFILLIVALLIAGVALHSQSALLKQWGSTLPLTIGLVSTAVSVSIQTVLFALVYRYLPPLKRWDRTTWFGALFAAVLFELGRWGFGIYLARSSVANAYGPSNAIVAFLVWTFFATQSLLLGAEVKAYLSQEKEPWSS